MLQKLTLLFPLWMIVLCAAALIWPEWLIFLNQGSVVVLILAFVMLCMGLTLTFDDFRRIVRMPKTVAIGFAAQYSIMPPLAYGIAYTLSLPDYFAVGLILVGCCPGGTASNLVTYIAKADVALSVVMTVCSTLAAVVLTPLLTQLFAGALVPVDSWLLFQTNIASRNTARCAGRSAQSLGAAIGAKRNASCTFAVRVGGMRNLCHCVCSSCGVHSQSWR